MKKLSEYEGDEALELLSDLIDPASVVLGDTEVAKEFNANNPLGACKVMLKKHKKEVVEILAVLDGEEPENYKVRLVTIPSKLLAIINDEDLWGFFKSQG